jgi:hypothetical protein
LQHPSFVQGSAGRVSGLPKHFSREKMLATVQDEGPAVRTGRGPVDDCMFTKFEVGHGAPVERLPCYLREAI